MKTREQLKDLLAKFEGMSKEEKDRKIVTDAQIFQKAYKILSHYDEFCERLWESGEPVNEDNPVYLGNIGKRK